jgi:cytochrome c biogenesis protein CcdA/thiol-disulfide isomerase/thioredoxin
MLLYLLAFVGGVLTIVSPCILPVLPFVFSRADQPFRRSGLPLLLGMGGTFALVAGLATYAGGWVVQANQVGRIVALVVFALLGLALLFPSLSLFLTQPLARLGARIQGPVVETEPPGIGRSVLLGASTGLLWAPCAGPILGLILTGAAVQGPNAKTTGLLLAFSAGAALSLALALLAGGKVFALMKKSLRAEQWIRSGLGVAVLIGVVAIAAGWDTGILRRLSLASTSGIEQGLVDRLRPVTEAEGAALPAAPQMIALATEGSLPSLDGAVAWLNSPPLTSAQLKGKVVLIDFWTYSCINCLRTIPYVVAWAEKYRADGLVVIGVHTPEFAFEKDTGNVSKALRELKITYPVAIDNKYAIWNAFHNQYWPAHYFVDAKGNIRYHHFGEGNYPESEQVIQQLLRERDSGMTVTGLVDPKASGAQAAADFGNVLSPETYLGYSRQKNYVSPEAILQDKPQSYTAPARLTANQWALGGEWNVSREHAALVAAPGTVVYRFHARDLHLVLGPAPDGKPVRFRVRLDGAAPGDEHGMDTDPQGDGTVTEYRLYQLIRQPGKVEDHTFEIEFLDPGIQAFAFTFG